MYRFYIEYENGNCCEWFGLSKQEAKRRNKEAVLKLGNGIKECGWEVMQ